VTHVRLHLGHLRADGYKIVRSGIRWLCEHGQYCRPNQVIAYCNINLVRAVGWLGAPSPFPEELTTQIALAPRIGGRISIKSGVARGGYLDIMAVADWNDEVIGHIDPETPDFDHADAGRLKLLILAGRRMTALADVHSGLLPGWNGRTRGWWCEAAQTPLTLLSLGICDATGVVVGEQCAFLEMFEATQAPSQIVFVPDQPLAPAAPILLDSLRRTPAQMQAISSDILQFLADSSTAPSGDDWMFAGSLLSVMSRNPIKDSYTVFSASGSSALGPADVILLSLMSEPQIILRHKKLGFRAHILRHHQLAAGPAMREWLSKAFEPVRRSTADIQQDYLSLIDAVASSTGGRLIILNRMSTSGFEDISSYLPFDAPMSDTLANIASKELNLMLHDLAEQRELYIVDVDAIAAELGGGEHLPDGTHQSGLMQKALRGGIIDILDHIRAEADRRQVTS
jgi:hypothetical protein